MAILNNSNAITTTGGYDVNNSLRFRSSASAYLSRTPASSGTRTTWTWSSWVKRGALSVSSSIISCGSFSTNLFQVFFDDSTNTLRIQNFPNSATPDVNVHTTQVFRDPSAWYHIVVVMDTTQATASNRVKIYVNGSQVSAFSTATYPSQNATPNWNTGSLQHNIGARDASTLLYDGYIAEAHFIDGSAKAASDFGETDTTTGVWKPKPYSGTYGTNGFYLKFSDIATTSGSNAGLGKDFSGNGNYFNTNNISVTSGTTYDAMTDSPTNTSATVANYSTLNPLKYAGTLSNANLNLTATASSWQNASSTLFVNSGKWYFEATVITRPVTYGCMIGIGTPDSNISTTYGSGDTFTYLSDGTKYGNGSFGGSYGATFTVGDVIGVAFDCDAGTITFYKNNTSQGTAFSNLVAGSFYGAWLGVNTSASSIALNCGQRPFSYTPPTGYVALNTYNLPDSTVKKGDSYFGITLYTGSTTGTGQTQTISHGQSFTPNFVWIKNRSAAHSHQLYDVIRGYGSNKNLKSNATDQEGLYGDTNGYVSAVSSSQLTTISGSNATAYGEFVNQNTRTYVAWLWSANGAGVTNTSGSITSTVSANTTAGFSIVTYTANSNSTVGHGLGVAPKVVIMKSRTINAGWIFGSDSIGWTNFLWLNLTNASSTNSTVWNNTAPTSSVFTLGSGVSTANYGDMVAYCWAEIAGFSKFGSYTGNGSTDGPFVFTGFRPKFVMIKRTDAANDWNMYDSSIGAYNVIDDLLKANTSAAETTYYTYYIDFLSNGFKLRETDTGQNASGGTYIFMAFAENPFKNANAR